MPECSLAQQRPERLRHRVGGFVGSLIVEADGDGVVGDVIFGDSADFAYAASLPLQTQAFTEALFNQVANVSGFFTGLAFFYPGSAEGGSPQGPQPDTEITIQVFLPGGEMVGESLVTLGVGERTSQLVEQLVGEIELAGRVRADSLDPGDHWSDAVWRDWRGRYSALFGRTADGGSVTHTDSAGHRP